MAALSEQKTSSNVYSAMEQQEASPTNITKII